MWTPGSMDDGELYRLAYHVSKFKILAAKVYSKLHSIRNCFNNLYHMPIEQDLVMENVDTGQTHRWIAVIGCMCGKVYFYDPDWAYVYFKHENPTPQQIIDWCKNPPDWSD